MSSLNQVTLLGNVGQDPDVRKTQSGDTIVNLSMATSESWKDRNTGEKRERTEWHRVAIFGNLAKIAEQYVSKGSKVLVQGQLRTRKWQDQSGNDRYTTEVVLSGFQAQLKLISGRDQSGGGGGYDNRGGGGNHGQQQRQQPQQNDIDDEIPF